ncbi:hypothetical protein BJF79_44060 [Actinomadura sp. CNU-125]|uniref:AI-2E family transporter n=1 Tax=Actinomadura sp. CNU-125 TaxID=1904961 RepID=UPI000963A479|nr:AI-2E family transporter [Actinomadura sp. CNU-125]OLT25766.1 hypothetical protein BJF79_44060 [Actinomadura sp. CNU-125]
MGDRRHRLRGVFKALAVLLFTFYLSAEGPQFRRTVCSVLPPHRQRQVLAAWEIAVDKTGGYIYSRALLALVSGVAHYIAMAGLGVPYAATLALWVGVLSQFIPVVGTYLAGAVPVLVALTEAPATALWMLLFIVAYQQLENYLLQPRITARTMAMHPAVAFGLVLAGAAVVGPAGALLALPLGASVQAFAGAYIRRYDIEEHPLTEPPARRARRPAPPPREPRRATATAAANPAADDRSRRTPRRTPRRAARPAGAGQARVAPIAFISDGHTNSLSRTHAGQLCRPSP